MSLLIYMYYYYISHGQQNFLHIFICLFILWFDCFYFFNIYCVTHSAGNRKYQGDPYTKHLLLSSPPHPKSKVKTMLVCMHTMSLRSTTPLYRRAWAPPQSIPNIPWPQKEARACSSHVPISSSPWPGQLLIYLLPVLAYSGHFIWEESDNMWPCVPGFFRSP